MLRTALPRRLRLSSPILAVALLLARGSPAQTAAPDPAPTSTSQSPPTPAPPAPAGDDAQPSVVVVHGKKASAQDVGAVDLRGQDVRGVAGTFGDPFQAVQALPGVAATASGLPYFYVRGAPPADSGYFLDGIPLPALFHIGPGPSVVPPAMVDHVDFFPSAAPARFGRFVGGIISGTTTAPSNVARGEAEVRLFDASAFAESPIGADTSALVAGRYGYPNLLLSIFAPSLSLRYWDYTTRVTHALSDHDAISLFVIGAYDHEQDASQDLTPVDSQFHRIDLRYDHRWSGGSLRLASTFGYDRTSTLFTNSNQVATETSGRLRLELDQRLGRDARLSAGADANAAHYLYAFTGPGAVTAPLDAEQVGGAYADLTLHPARRVELGAGIRFDAYRTRGTVMGAVDPKLMARVSVAPGLSWVSTFGIAHQEASYVVPVPGLSVGSSGGLQAVYQLAEGIEARLPLDLSATVTGFYNVDRNTSDFVGDCGTLATNCTSVDRVNGRTYGLEVLVRRAFARRLSGWVSYTLSRAERRIENVPYLSPFDRTHVLSAVLSYDFGAGIRAGARATYYTGRPDIPTFLFPGSPTDYEFAPGQLSQHRLPDFFRLDLRLEKRWQIGSQHREWISAIVEFFDATLAKEAIDFQCVVIGGLCQARYIGPIALPSIGLEAGF